MSKVSRSRKSSKSSKALKFDRGDQVHVGLDVHKKSIHAAIWSDGQVVRHWVMPADPPTVAKQLEPLAPALVRVVYEAGPTGFALARHLRAAGLATEVIAPSKTPQAADRSAKCDRRDCMELAEYSASKKELAAVAVPTEQEEADRQVQRLRDQTVRKLRRVKQQIKSLLLQHGIAEPAGLADWSGASVRALGELPLIGELRFCLDELLEELSELNARMGRINRRVERLAGEGRHAAAVAVLESIPGVGPVTAMTVITELHTPGRFKDGAQVGKYLGLCPRVSQSGGTRRDGPICKTGRGHARAILVQAAWRWRNQDPHARAIYDRLLANTGVAQKAIVGVARRLAMMMWRMLTTGEYYRHAA